MSSLQSLGTIIEYLKLERHLLSYCTSLGECCVVEVLRKMKAIKMLIMDQEGKLRFLEAGIEAPRHENF